jgi:hypothetical protein
MTVIPLDGELFAAGTVELSRIRANTAVGGDTFDDSKEGVTGSSQGKSSASA